MMVFLFFKIGQFLGEISPVFTVDLNIAKIVKIDHGKHDALTVTTKNLDGVHFSHVNPQCRF